MYSTELQGHFDKRVSFNAMTNHQAKREMKLFLRYGIPIMVLTFLSCMHWELQHLFPLCFGIAIPFASMVIYNSTCYLYRNGFIRRFNIFCDIGKAIFDHQVNKILIKLKRDQKYTVAAVQKIKEDLESECQARRHTATFNGTFFALFALGSHYADYLVAFIFPTFSAAQIEILTAVFLVAIIVFYLLFRSTAKEMRNTKLANKKRLIQILNKIHDNMV